ncbi:multifamily domain protein, partial [Chlamydia psittaci 84-8471/1]
HNRRIP